ncbi:hypothetical protein [Bdellovibrio sp. HCB209]|uniref:hypothetical protein n=1 Tax=Bdellovibrio sp. HCB209 TaxID=3394354 RepID=UPI0039B68B4A
MFKRGSLLLSTGLCSLLLSNTAHAEMVESVSTTIHHQYESQRALGMGDAFVAVADDYTSIFYNPAGLARRESGQVNLSLAVGATPGAKDFMDEYQDIEQSGQTDQQKEQQYLELIQRHYGDVYSVRLTPMEGVWVRPKWGIAFIPADVSIELRNHQTLGPSMYTTVYADTTLALSYGDDVHAASHGRLSWGVTGKFVNRGFYSKILSAVDLSTSDEIVKKEDMLEGYTIDADLGLLWTPEIPTEGLMSFLQYTRPTVGLVVRNIAETGFNNSLKLIKKDDEDATVDSKKIYGSPEKLYRVVDVGTKFEFPRAWIFGGRFVADIRDIMHPDWSWTKGTHAGVEFDWTVYSWWKGHYRAGLSQGFWTAGLSAELGIFNLDLVSYANNAGTKNTPLESRVYATRMSLDF